MAVSYIGAGASNGGASSATTTPNVAVPGAAAVGDLVIAVASCERDTLIPNVTWPTAGETVARSESQATGAYSCQMEWKRLVSGDLGGNLAATVTTGRRIAFGFVVLRGAADPVFTNGSATVNGSGDLAAEHPNVTPTTGDSWLVSLLAATTGNGAIRTMSWTSSGAYTERADNATPSTSSIGAGIYIATQALTGGAGSSQTGNVATEATDRFNYFPTTVVVAPFVAPPPHAVGYARYRHMIVR